MNCCELCISLLMDGIVVVLQIFNLASGTHVSLVSTHGE